MKKMSPAAVAMAALFATALMLGNVQGAMAQTCLGVPAGAGQYAVTGGFGFTDGQKSFGFGGTANLVGPFSVTAQYSLTTFDGPGPNMNSLATSAAYELPLKETSLSACPIAGVGYSRVSDDDTAISAFSMPFGIALGTTLEGTNGFNFTPFATPQLIYSRTTISSDFADEDFTDSSTEFGTAFGTAFSGEQFYATVAALLTTVEGSEPSFSISLGMIIP